MTKMVGSWIRMESSGRLGGGMPVVVPEELFVCVVLSSVEVWSLVLVVSPWSLVLVVSPVVQPGLWPGNGSVPAR